MNCLLFIILTIVKQYPRIVKIATATLDKKLWTMTGFGITEVWLSSLNLIASFKYRKLAFYIQYAYSIIILSLTTLILYCCSLAFLYSDSDKSCLYTHVIYVWVYSIGWDYILNRETNKYMKIGDLKPTDRLLGTNIRKSLILHLDSSSTPVMLTA